MKKINIKSTVIYLILLVSMVSGVNSCKKDKNTAGGPPVITRVRTVYQNVTDSNVVHHITLDSNSIYSQAGVTSLDSTTTDGKIGGLYAIIGQNLNTTSAVYMNGVSVYFNPAYLSKTSILVTIPTNVPYSNDKTNNILTVVTPQGKADFKFVIEQPMPAITTVSQLAGNAGDVITVAGTTFNGLTGVFFGTIPGQVISTSLDVPTQVTTLTVKVPSGVTAAPILVKTAATKGGGVGTGPLLSSGTSELTNNVTAVHQANGIFGFSTPIFEDQLESGWYDYGWSNSPQVDATLQKRGTSSIKVSYAGGYDGFAFGANNVPASKNAAIKFSLYGGKGTNGKNVHVVLNGNFNVSVQISLVEGKWTDYIIPIQNWVDGSNPLPTFINGLVFQEFSGNASVFNIDDVGIVDIPSSN